MTPPAREPDFWTGIIGICAIAFIISVGLVCGYNHTLVKLGIAAIAAISGFAFRGLIRWP